MLPASLDEGNQSIAVNLSFTLRGSSVGFAMAAEELTLEPSEGNFRDSFFFLLLLPY